MKHITKEGKKIKLKDLETSHLKNIITMIERRAKNGFTIRLKNPKTINDIKQYVKRCKSFCRLILAKCIDVDLERYENLKSENKKMKNKFSDIGNELKLQIDEMNLSCKHKAEDINNHYPKDNGLKNIADAYNNSANTERLIYKQKLEFIKTMTER
jgi:hypothetical protein